jgi:GGDEF domain-containing protein
MVGLDSAIGHPALTDAETGLANRLHFELVYSYLFAGADRGVPLTLMLVSASAADLGAVKLLGGRIRETMRAADLVAHLGGGRFAALLLGSNLSGGRVAADRVEMALHEVATAPVALALAAYRPEMREPSELIQAADDALRRAAEAGGGLEMAS